MNNGSHVPRLMAQLEQENIKSTYEDNKPKSIQVRDILVKIIRMMKLTKQMMF